MPKEDDATKDEAQAEVKPRRSKSRAADEVAAEEPKKSTTSKKAEASADEAAVPVKMDSASKEADAKSEDTSTEEKPTDAADVKTQVAPAAPTADAAAKKRLLRPIKPKDLRGFLVKFAAGLVALVAVVVIVFGVLVYVYRSDNPVVAAVAKVIPYPVERVNGRFVTYNSYLFEVNANKRAYQNNAKLNNQPAVDFNSADGKKLVQQIKEHALEKLANDALTAQLADQKKVKVSNKQVDDLINQLYTRYGGKDTLLKTLKQIYGWDLGDLKKVVYNQLLAKNLEEKVTSDPALDTAAKNKANDVLKKIKDGQDFTEVAKKYSQASDASSGGDLGFFTKGQLPDDLQKVAEALQPGQVSDPIKDQYGYEIMKVIEKKEDGSIHAQHILIKTIDYEEYFSGELKKAKINKYLKVS